MSDNFQFEGWKVKQGLETSDYYQACKNYLLKSNPLQFQLLL